MGSRIITLQRQARELGRLRAGYTDTSGARPRPARSTTWIVTSHSRDYVDAAAAEWGGTVEEWEPQGSGARQWRVITEATAVDAILPPGDPVSQYYEAWSRGGCARRCDGEIEQISDRPCLCRAQWGEAFHEVARDACKMTTRLSVILPALPDLGVWRLETHSYYAASEIAATVDVLKGQLGAAAMIPVRLRIEPRTRVAGGKTKQFPVPVVELRGATAGQVLAGTAPAVAHGQAPAAVTAQQQAPALPAATPARDWESELDDATSSDAVRALYRACVAAGEMTPYLAERMRDAAATLDAVAQGQPVATAGPAPSIDPDPTPTPAKAPAPAPAAAADDLWQQIIMTAGDGWTVSALEAAYAARHDGELPATATPDRLASFLSDLRAGWITPDGAVELDRPPY